MQKVLVVDDNRGLADAVALLLEDLGWTVRVAYEGGGACEEVARFYPDVVILDIRLPGMNGVELARRIRSMCLMPVLLIAFTGSVLAAEHALLTKDFAAVIRKPAAFEDIVRAIGAASPQPATHARKNRV